MADFCKECSIRVLGEDFGDLAGIADKNEIVWVLCEGCGFIYIDSEGKKIESNLEEQ